MAFSLFISLSISTMDYLRIRAQALDHNQELLQYIEESVIEALETVEKAYALFDKELAQQMEAATRQLMDLYAAQPDHGRWDFQQLKRELGYDVYIISQDLVITHSSFAPDVGLDFRECCGKLVPMLEEAFLTGQFYHDGLDIEQHTGRIKKYSYQSTPDGQYLIELGKDIESDEVFATFNFLDKTRELARRYPLIQSIEVLNIGGYALGLPAAEAGLTQERRAAFDQALSLGKTTEVKELREGEQSIYRYVPYTSSYDQGSTRHKVIEIAYDAHNLESVLDEHLNVWLLQLGIVLLVTALLSLVISWWVAEPLHLAFHDRLTGLRNRAALEDDLQVMLAEPEKPVAMMLLDLDNFKAVNDQFGHDAGDRLLQRVARQISAALPKGQMAYRWGGDEFVVLLPGATREQVEAQARRLIRAVQGIVAGYEGGGRASVSVSIGIAFAPEHAQDPEVLHKKADLAMYQSKNRGKNQYHIYEDSQT